MQNNEVKIFKIYMNEAVIAEFTVLLSAWEYLHDHIPQHYGAFLKSYSQVTRIVKRYKEYDMNPFLPQKYLIKHTTIPKRYIRTTPVVQKTG